MEYLPRTVPKILLDANLCLRADFPDGEGKHACLFEALILRPDLDGVLWRIYTQAKERTSAKTQKDGSFGEQKEDQSGSVSDLQAECQDKVREAAGGSSYKEQAGFI